MAALVLDRMRVEDVGLNPRRLAEAIHEQLACNSGPVPVRDIALALDIEEIREKPLTRLEAALVTTPERDRGKILLNSKSSNQRRRFSLGHELLHFLNQCHEQTAPDGFHCSLSDMGVSSTNQARHVRQEAEANAFAIELLTPRFRLKPLLRSSPDLEKILKIADEFDISKEAAARRYVQLHEDSLAAVFTKEGRFAYAERGRAFPFIDIRQGEGCRIAPMEVGAISEIDEVDISDWLGRKHNDAQLTAQTLGQAQGYAITLLCAALPDEDDDPGIDDTYQRFHRL